MFKNILYISNTEHQYYFNQFLIKQGATTQEPLASFYKSSRLDKLIPGLEYLQFDFIDNLDALAPYMKLTPPDLIIYDERGDKTLPALDAAKQIHNEIKKISQVWGPDFSFPMSKVFVVSSSDNSDRYIFEMGRLKVGDFILKPKSDDEILYKIVLYFNRRSQLSDEFGIALGGGGIEGFLFQIGAIYALQMSLKGRKLHHAKVISGVSSGSIAGAMLAAKVDTLELIKALTTGSDKLGKFKSSLIFDFATKDIAQRIFKEQLSITGLLPNQWLNKILRSIPVGFFKGESLEEYFRKVLMETTSKNNFSRLDTTLLIGATDQDNFKHVIFGDDENKEVPISQAIRASCSLPPFFTPSKINDRWYLDGQITKSCDLELCIQKGSRLCIILDPLKPYTSQRAGLTEEEGGFYTAIQTIKAIMSSRFEESLRHVTERFPQVDFIIIQPDEVCSEQMRGSPMKFTLRTAIIDFAYRGTLNTIMAKHSTYSNTFKKYGFILRDYEEIQALKQESIY